MYTKGGLCRFFVPISIPFPFIFYVRRCLPILLPIDQVELEARWNSIHLWWFLLVVPFSFVAAPSSVLFLSMKGWLVGLANSLQRNWPRVCTLNRGFDVLLKTQILVVPAAVGMCWPITAFFSTPFCEMQAAPSKRNVSALFPLRPTRFWLASFLESV